MLLPESHSSDYSVALPSLAKLTLCAAAIQAACFSFPALAADNPVVEKTAYSDIISPDPSNPSNWVVNRGTDDPAKGIAEILNAIKETREDLNPNLDIRGLSYMLNDENKKRLPF